jgi:hypothetical protein
MKSGEDTLLKDKDGKAILVHSYVADAAGARYYINAYCQAVPTGEGVAVELKNLIRDSEVRVLSAAEVLQLESEKSAPAKPAQRKARARKPEKDAEAPTEQAPAEEPQNGSESAKPDVSSAETKAELAMVLKLIPDQLLAEELRRRGWHVVAVKPALVNL